MTISRQDETNEETIPTLTDGTQPQEKRRDLSSLPRRNALNCTPDELVATSWEYPGLCTAGIASV